MIDLHRLSDPAHPYPLLTPRRCYPQGLSRHRVSQDYRHRWQFVLPKVPENNMMSRALFFHPQSTQRRGAKKRKENQTFNNLQRRPTTYARMTNRLRTPVFLPVVLLFQSLFIKYTRFVGSYTV